MTQEKQKSDVVSEFDLINRFFSHIGKPTADILLGVGDDAALVSCGRDALAITVDTLVSGVHFFSDDPPDSIAHKALAVNLSDIAAMGAVPFAFLLSITLPESHEAWLTSFSSALQVQALRHHVSLIGGNTTRGPLTVSVIALGRVKGEKSLQRSQAKVGDDIYVTGELGLAAFYVYAKTHHLKTNERAMQAYRYPEPPIAFGQRLCGLAHAAIDISDGLMGDLSHILKASKVGATLVRSQFPIAPEWENEEGFYRAVTSGDDYELCFTAPKSAASMLKLLAETDGVRLSLIGEVVEENGIKVDGKIWRGNLGYDHFL